MSQAFARVFALAPRTRVGSSTRRKTNPAFWRGFPTTSRELGIGDSVVMTGGVDHRQVARYYSLIDIFVVPRIRSRVCEVVTPLKPYEAMSTGRVVVVSDVEALREMIVEGETGVSFRAGDHDDLARLCVGLLSNAERRGELARRAAEWTRQNRTWKQVCATYLDVYESARDRFAARKTPG